MNRNRAIESVKALLPKDEEIEKIIHYCNLYPVSSWKKWSDNCGNFIQIYSKKIKSFINNPIDLEDKTITDLYHQSHPSKIAALSKWSFISFGKDNDNVLNICFIWFLGKDNKLRMVTLKKGHWLKNNPPLICGIDIIRPIIRSSLTNNGRADILNIKGPIATKIVCSWATAWPPPENVLSEMNNKDINLTEEVIKLCN